MAHHLGQQIRKAIDSCLRLTDSCEMACRNWAFVLAIVTVKIRLTPEMSLQKLHGNPKKFNFRESENHPHVIAIFQENTANFNVVVLEVSLPALFGACIHSFIPSFLYSAIPF